MKTRVLGGCIAATLAASALAQNAPSRTAFAPSGEVVSNPRAADIIIDRSGTFGQGVIAQHFSDFPTFDASAFDLFTTDQDYTLDRAVSLGFEQGNPDCTTQVVAEIWEADPDDCDNFPQTLVATVDGIENAGNLEFDFDGFLLPAGTYYFTAYIVRPFGGGCGQRFSYMAAPSQSGEDLQIFNPGNGLQCGTCPIEANACIDPPPGQEVDLAWTLEGTPAGGSGCQYALKKNSKPKKGCDVCPRKGDLYSTGDPCEDKKDCTKKVKIKQIDCPDGGEGICKKIKGKRDSCL